MHPGEIFYVVNVEAVVTDGVRYLMGVRSLQEEHGPGEPALPGGKVEAAGVTTHILEETARREVLEETGVTVAPQMVYLRSSAFTAANGWPVVDIVFLCHYQSGEARARQPEEMVELRWMTAAEIYATPGLARWTRESIVLAEQIRLAGR